MTNAEVKRGRTRPCEDDPPEEDQPQQTGFSQSVPGAYRSRVKDYANSAAWPSEPLYRVNEIVYISIPGQQLPAGPYKIVSSNYDSATYTLEQQNNGQAYPYPVREADIRVPVNGG